MFSQYLTVCPSIEYGSSFRDAITTQMYVALNLCFLCNLGLPSQGSSIRKKTCHAPNTSTLQHDTCRPIRRSLPNRGNGIIVFESSTVIPNWANFEYSYSVALFTESPQIELHYNFIHTNRAIMLGSICTGRMTCFSPNRAALAW